MNNYFVIEMQLPSLNEYQNECRRNKYCGAKFKKDFERSIEMFIWKYKRKGLLRSPVSYPVEINVEWHEKDKRRDVDNIKSSMKFILDTLTSTEIIKDDGRKFISQIHDTIINEPTKRTFVVVEIVEPNNKEKQ